MTDYDETAGTEDPQSLLGELRRIVGLEDDATALPEEPADNEAWGAQHLRKVTITPPAVVSAAADLVIPPREPRPEARSRMIEAAGRALADRRKMNGLLPVLLRSVREDADLTIADVAERSVSGAASAWLKWGIDEAGASERHQTKLLSAHDVGCITCRSSEDRCETGMKLLMELGTTVEHLVRLMPETEDEDE